MKIVFLGNFLPTYSSESHHAAALELLGHDVIRMQESQVSSLQLRGECYNAHIFVWVHSHGWNPTADNFPIALLLKDLHQRHIPTLTYHLDLYMGIASRWSAYQRDPYLIGGLQHFFTVDSLMADWLNKHTTTKGHWLPAGVHEQECVIAEPTQPFDVCFVGSKNYHSEWPDRAKLIEWLESTYGERFTAFGPDFGRHVRGLELNQVYANARIVVGDSFCPTYHYPGRYWSDRATETLGRGGFLIHPRVPHMDEVFTDREHLVYYDYTDYDGLSKLIDYYLEHDDEREHIRKSGYEYVKANHTYTHRWQQILDTILTQVA